MFERFTERARHVVVLAQEEARLLQHNYIGTEHLLLGLLHERDGIAGRALTQTGATLDAARAYVEVHTKKAKHPPSGHIPFTPRAKKVLELALREALTLKHNYIGTEHILLGLMREGEGLGVQTLREACVDLTALRMRVLDLAPAGESTSGRRLPGWLRKRSTEPTEPDPDVRTTSATDLSLEEARRLAGDAAVGSHHLLLATLSDPTSAAARALAGLGIDLDRARDALRTVEVAGTSDELPEESGRRQMTMRLTDRTLVVETSDPALLGEAREAFASLAVPAPVEVRGDHDAAAGFADLWLACQQALQRMRPRG